MIEKEDKIKWIEVIESLNQCDTDQASYLLSAKMEKEAALVTRTGFSCPSCPTGVFRLI